MGTYEYPLMRRAGALLAEVADVLRPCVVVGATPLDLDTMAEDAMLQRGCQPAFKGYRGFPRSVCISTNHEVVHGIPHARPFKYGDTVSIDIGLVHAGYYADMAFTVVLDKGENSEAWRLVRATEEAFAAGLSMARPGMRTGDVGAAIQAVVESYGFGNVVDFVGHGIGRNLHEQPPVPNFGKAGKGTLLKPGLAIAIEPMLTLGSPKVRTLSDDWTVVTQDRSLAAHHEHTVLITERGPEVLTA